MIRRNRDGGKCDRNKYFVGVKIFLADLTDFADLIIKKLLICAIREICENIFPLPASLNLII